MRSSPRGTAARRERPPAASSDRGLGMEAVAAMTSRVPHHMLREIREQPVALARLLDSAPKDLRDLTRRLRRHPPSGVILAARGTSDNAAVYGKYLIESVMRLPAALAAPSIVTLYRTRLHVRGHLVIGLSQSGESTDIVEFVESCRRRGALTLGITNDPDSALARSAHYALELHAGRERSVAATKTYLSQLAALAALVFAWTGARDLAALPELPALVTAALQLEPEVRDQAGRYRYMNGCMVTSRGFNYATARETALKLEETCNLLAEAFSSADLLHGPIAAVERDFPVMLFAFKGKAFDHLCQVAAELASKGAELLVVANDHGALRRATVGLHLSIAVSEVLSPIPAVVPGQLLAYYLSVSRGLNPDQPRGLTKVTRTR